MHATRIVAADAMRMPIFLRAARRLIFACLLPLL